jgi:8-oxo-dGTP diphosphatase/2-hydroxy-dATP diphosphatase
MIKQLTLGIVCQPPRVLLGMKKRGFGAGRWNGFGGKLQDGESLEESLRREFKEEAGIDIDSVEKRGILEFEFPNSPEVLQVHVYLASHFTGEVAESEEMRPQWFAVDAIPFANMWPDDEFWLPLFLAGKKFQGKFWFDENNEILKQELNEVGQLD